MEAIQMMLDARRYHGLAIASRNAKVKANNWDLVIINDTQNKYPEAWFECGLAYLDLGEFSSAIERFNTAVKVNPENYMAFNNRGIAKDGLRDYKGAIEDYNISINLNPKDPYSFCNRGAAKSALGDPIGALIDYTKAIDLKYDYFDAYLNR